METILTLIILGIFGETVLIGKILIALKKEQTKSNPLNKIFGGSEKNE